MQSSTIVTVAVINATKSGGTMPCATIIHTKIISVMICMVLLPIAAVCCRSREMTCFLQNSIPIM